MTSTLNLHAVWHDVPTIDAEPEQLFRATLEHLPVAVCVCSPVVAPTGGIIDVQVDFANAVARRIFGDESALLSREHIDFLVGGEATFMAAWNGSEPVTGALDLLNSERGCYFELTMQRVGERVLVTMLDRTEEMSALSVSATSDRRRRRILQHLTQPVLLFSPVFDGDRIVDLVLVETNTAALHANPLLRPGQGVLEGECFADPHLAFRAAEAAWSGVAEPYEVRRPDPSGVHRFIVHEVWTTRVDDDIMQVSLDRTSEAEMAEAERQFRLTADLLDQPLHLHEPVLDAAGEVVDTVIVFANRSAEAMDASEVGHVGLRSSMVLPDPSGDGLALYRAAWSDTSGRLHRLTFDNLDGHLHSRPMVFMEVQARRVGDRLVTVGLDRTEVERVTRQAVASRDQLAVMFETLAEAVIVFDADLTIRSVNAAAEQLADLRAEEMIGATLGDIDVEFETDDGVYITRPDRVQLVSGGDLRNARTAVLRRRDGQTFHLVFTVRELRLLDGSVGRLVTASNVTEVHRALMATEQAEQQFRSTVDAISDPVLLLEHEGPDTCVIYGNAAAALLGGSQLVGSVHRPVRSMALAEPVAGVLCTRSLTAPAAGVEVDGRAFDVSLSESGGRRVAVFRDVSRQRAEAALLAHMARHDPVSGLANRRGLDAYLGELLAGRCAGSSVAVVVVKIDQVEAVQRSFGFGAADELLAELLERVKAKVRAMSASPDSGARPVFVAHLTGSSFALVLDERERAAAVSFAEGVVAELAVPVSIDGLGLQVEVSAGVVFAPLHGSDSETLVMRAKSAAWTARHRHSSVFVWQPDVDRDRLDRVALLADVAKALENDDLSVEYQPKIDLRTGCVVGAEALARWVHPTIGPLPPARFIGEVEDSMLAGRFTAWILRRALQEWVALAPPPGVRLAVNLPPVLAGDPGLCAMVESALIATGASPSMLELELTERGLVSPGPVVLSNMATLGALGVHFVIDDFGTGQASLLYLRRLPVQALKIDRTFMLHLERDRVNRAIVTACVGVAASLDIDVVAEGLETEAEVAAALELGCGFGQGFHIAAPAPMAQLQAELRNGLRLRWPVSETL